MIGDNMMFEKALEIIITKNVNIKWLKIFSKQDDLEYALTCYNSYSLQKDALTLEEFTLLIDAIKKFIV